MANLILRTSPRMPHFTNMRAVFEALPGTCARYDWLISEPEYVWNGLWWGPGAIPTPLHTDDWSDLYERKTLDSRLSIRPSIIPGNDLEEMLAANEIQWIWGVFSGLPRGYKKDLLCEPLPYSYFRYWQGVTGPQLPDAELEIVCWDSCLCLLIGADDDQAASFQKFFPEAMDLDAYDFGDLPA